MAEAKQFTFTYKEVAEMMVRQLGLSEGLWGVHVRFGLSATNIGPGPDEIVPAAIVPVLELGLQRFEEPSRLTVDAAEIARGAPGKGRRSRATGRAALETTSPSKK